MKHLLHILLFSISIIATAQTTNRTTVNGRIIVEGSDIEGIAVYNSTSNKGTITDKNGEFIINVALNDIVEIKSLEYQNLEIQINEDILKSRRLSVYLIQEINKLDEVIISNKTLTGNIKTDMAKVKTFSPKLDAFYFGVKPKNSSEYYTQRKQTISDVTTHSQGQPMVNGLNVVNVVDQLLIPLFRSEVKDKNAVGITDIPVNTVKYYLASDYLVNNFNIPPHRVEEFIRYVEDDTFDFKLLNYGNEMEFLEILSVKSKAFLNTKNTN